MIRGIYESGTLAKHISCKCECKFDDRKYNLNKKWNNNKCQCDCKNPKEHCVCEKELFLESAKCSCENGKYARSIGNSVVIYGEIIEETRAIPTKSTSAKSVPTKSTSTNFYL